jgi:hypothetical protein
LNTQTNHKINFYESKQDIGVIEPDAVISSEDLTATIKRFISMAAMIATHPDLAETFGETSTAPIRLATDLQTALKNSVEDRIYPNIVLPSRNFTATMTLMGITRTLEPEFHEMIARQNQRWEEEILS